MKLKSIVSLNEVARIGISNAIGSQIADRESFSVITHGALSDYPVFSPDYPIVELSVAQRRYALYPAGTILVSMGRYSWGIGLLGMEAFTDRSVCGIIVNSTYVLPEYMYHVLRWYRSGDTRRWNQQFLKELTVPLPPIGEQAQIVKVLGSVDSTRRKQEKLILLLNEYIQSQYVSIIERELPSRPKSTLRELLVDIEVGTRVQSERLPSGTFVLKGKLTNYVGNQLTELSHDTDAYDLINQRLVFSHPDDVLWNRYSDEKVLQQLIINRWETPVVISNAWIRLRTSNRLTKDVLVNYLRRNYENSKYIFRYSTRRELVELIGQLPITVPNVRDQEKFSTIASWADKAIFKTQESIAKLKILYLAYLDEMLFQN